MFNVTEFVVGTIAPVFKYHDKVRQGVVEKVAKDVVTLKYMNDGKLEYKSFSVSKMQPVE